MTFRTDRLGVRYAPMTLAAAASAFIACGSDDSTDPMPDGTVGINVASVFPAGTEVRDAYTGVTATVDDDGNAFFVPGPESVVLIERAADAQSTPAFTWDNATVYFLMTDRFENGDTTNDVGYPGRESSDTGRIGSWYGGDFVGLTSRLDHLVDLGVDAIWLSFPVEQVHGWVGGGNGDFQHFAYHGYWPLDFTRIDANYGTEAELEALVNAAHSRGLRVIFDVVLNHAGYATMQDLSDYLPDVLDEQWVGWTPGASGSWHDFNDLFINFGSAQWQQWWGADFIRSATFSNHIVPGMDDRTRELDFLPDFRTENTSIVDAPPFFANKSDTGVETIADFTVREYLVKWVTDWVARFGVDGFRVDTAKHVEFETWSLLKSEATRKLAEWKATNPTLALDDTPFWMTGEVFPHGVVRDEYFDNGFDSLINFDFQRVAANVATSPNDLDMLYSTYASTINSDATFNVLTYISSHDTALLIERIDGDTEVLRDVATAFMMLPGAVQIFYGDETARRAWGDGISDDQQGTRAPMNWDSIDAEVLAHWQKLGQFRKRHPAIGAGMHSMISVDDQYVFSRQLGDDAVVVAVLGESSDM